MNTLLHLEIPAGSDDALGVSSVNGVYGPGAWIFWALTILLSWASIFENDNSKDFQYVSHLLYTNWAAIDLFCRLPKAYAYKYITDNFNQTSQGPIAAAFTITYWGLLHASLQLLFCFSYAFFGTARPRSGPVRRCLILLLGIVIPSSTSWVLIAGFPGDRTKGPAFDWTSLPALYYDNIRQISHLQTIRIISTTMLIENIFALYVVSFLLYSTARPWRKRGMDLKIQGGLLALVYLALVLVQAIFIVRYPWHVIRTGGRIVSNSCYFMPCAPQALSESDQAFALFAGLAMVVYELGPKLWTRCCQAVAYVKRERDSRLQQRCERLLQPSMPLHSFSAGSPSDP